MLDILKYYHYSYRKAFIKLFRELTDLSTMDPGIFPVKWDGYFTDSLNSACYATVGKE